jgi:hypothetical protein
MNKIQGLEMLPELNDAELEMTCGGRHHGGGGRQLQIDPQLVARLHGGYGSVSEQFSYRQDGATYQGSFSYTHDARGTSYSFAESVAYGPAVAWCA